MILLDAGQHVLGRRIMAGANSAILAVRRTGWGEAGTLLFRAGTECEK